MGPNANWLPLTDRAAVATPPEPDKATAPRTVWPRVKETVPVGDVVPVAAFTVAVKTVELELPALMLEEPAVTVVDVATVEAGVRVREKFFELLPNDAVILAVVLALTADVLTVKVVLVEPAEMLTDAGTVAAEAPLDRSMVVVLEAAALKVTVQVDDAGGVTLAGLQFRPESAAVTA